jgi:predicted MFS family arabinose efflux permease
MGVVAIAFLLAWIGGHGSMVALLAAGVALDAGVQGNQVVSQRIVFALGAEARSRLNGLYIAMFFTGGAAGSAVASLAYARGGWSAVSAIGLALPLLALALYATEFLPRRPACARVTAARD